MPMALIRKSCPEYSYCCLDVRSIAQSVVDNALCIARKLIESDPEQVFLYKRPTAESCGPENIAHPVSLLDATSLQPTTCSSKLSDSGSTLFQMRIEWITIQNFSLDEAMNQIRDYIDLWRLTPATKYVLVNHSVEEVPPKGRRHFVSAHFSKPTPMCPNPLAVATVHFTINVSDHMPKDYPVMVTYRFEGYKTEFHALGSRALRSMSFQRFYIDTILQMKLSFYAEISDYRHSIKNIEAAASEESFLRDKSLQLLLKPSTGDGDHKLHE